MFNSRRIRALSFSVDSGTPDSSEIFFRRLVNVRLSPTTLARIRTWLSLRVLRRSLRRSAKPPSDIGADARPAPWTDASALVFKLDGQERLPTGSKPTATGVEWLGPSAKALIFHASIHLVQVSH
jgi:hypothetical protein